jgi:DNA-binding NarL/FixJ family response regulator
MSRSATPGSEAQEVGAFSMPAAERKALLIVSEDDRFVSPTLAHAIGHEFPWLDVRLSASLRHICGGAVQIVPLILIDLTLFTQCETAIREVQGAHPHAAIAFLSKGDPSVAPREILALSQVRGVLPMNLALDVWLAAVRVLLLGGEYFASGFMRGALQSLVAARALPLDFAAPGPCAMESGPSLPGLTARELQILQLVARGQQNKLIASALQLSENTVKIHLHHIIAKLGVHNRTEAASLYLARAVAGRAVTRPREIRSMLL